MADTHVLTEDDDGSEIALRVGETLLLEFAENRTTGYLWEIGSTENLLEKVMDDFDPGQRIGAGGSRRMRFAGKTPGHSTLRLTLVREWDRDNPLKSWSADITVSP